MDVFHAGLKTEPRDFRHFVAFFPLLRFINVFLFSLSNGILYFPAAALMIMLSALTIATLKPSRNWYENLANIVTVGLLGMILCYFPGYNYFNENFKPITIRTHI